MSEDQPRLGNRLANAASPYLRSAAKQPVDWLEWGPDAFVQATAEDKPILLDIGAVWCHWCHVIDRESYEDPELAEVINRLFVPVKVDRDERPDVDSRYQTAVTAICGQGGWPLTGFLLPDGRPFYGGTYFPPSEAMGRPSFRRVLESVGEAFRSRRSDLERTAESLAGAVAQAEVFERGRGVWSPAIADATIDSIFQQYDPKYGGFGQGPKFPHSASLDLLLERYQSTRNGALLEVASFTLEKMAQGGVYDQLAGGFHRYSTDQRWLVPHFEKLSHDNSELLKNFLHAYQVTGSRLLGDTAAGIIAWVNSVLSDQENGGFYASQDADISLEDDGDYFTWTVPELRAAVPSEQAAVMELYYDVGPIGEMHENPAKNVLWVARPPEEIATALGRPVDEIETTIRGARVRLLAARNNRPAPFIDTTLYVSWNAMFVSAYLEAASVMEGEIGASCHAFAIRTIDRLLGEGWDSRRGFAHRIGSTGGKGAERLDGSLDDQVFAAAALLDAFEATLDRRYFEAAETTMQIVLDKYGDAERGGFFDRSSDAAPMGGLDLRRKPLQDSPTPGGNPAAVMVLDRLHHYTGNSRYRVAADAALAAFAAMVEGYGMFAATYALATVLHARRPIQIVVTGRAGDEAAAMLDRRARSYYRLGKAVLRVTSPDQLRVLPPSLAETLPGLFAGDGAKNAQALVCAGETCYPPVEDADQLDELLGRVGGASGAAGR